jgi:hypothetical protein
MLTFNWILSADLNKMFSDYAAKRGVRKSDETASNDISGTDDSLPSRNRENSKFIIQECPIVESSQKVSHVTIFFQILFF